MFDKQVLLKGVNQPEEKLLLAKVLDQADFSLRKQEVVFTDFITPRMAGIVYQAIQKIYGLYYAMFGGNENCERRKIGFAPEYCEIENQDFPIRVLKITTNTKFSSPLSHRDYLGSILGMGIDRGKIGDIFVYDDKTLCYVSEEIAGYLAGNLEKIGKTKAKVENLAIEEIILPEEKIKEKYITVSSLRLDAVLSAAFPLSRGKAQEMIEAEKAFVNWQTVKSVSSPIKEQDIISLRGYGRVKLIEIKGKTKKDKIGMILHLYM